MAQGALLFAALSAFAMLAKISTLCFGDVPGATFRYANYLACTSGATKPEAFDAVVGTVRICLGRSRPWQNRLAQKATDLPVKTPKQTCGSYNIARNGEAKDTCSSACYSPNRMQRHYDVCSSAGPDLRNDHHEFVHDTSSWNACASCQKAVMHSHKLQGHSVYPN